MASLLRTCNYTMFTTLVKLFTNTKLPQHAAVSTETELFNTIFSSAAIFSKQLSDNPPEGVWRVMCSKYRWASKYYHPSGSIFTKSPGEKEVYNNSRDV